jgi:hypothetical protein
MIRSAALALLMLIIAPAGASAGGFATVGLDSPLPQGTAAGEHWVAEFTVLAHGRTPADGLSPVVLIERASGGGAVDRFPASPSGAPGAYRADVVFPSEGRYRVLVDDDYSQVHSFPLVTVGQGDAAPGGDDPTLGFAFLLAGVAGLLAYGLVALLGHRRVTPAGTAPAR